MRREYRDEGRIGERKSKNQKKKKKPLWEQIETNLKSSPKCTG
jgi:hypothetical protein